MCGWKAFPVTTFERRFIATLIMYTYVKEGASATAYPTRSLLALLTPCYMHVVCAL